MRRSKSSGKVILILFITVAIAMLVLPVFGPFGVDRFNVTNQRLESLSVALSAFYLKYDRFPVGGNAGITAALLGNDRKQNPENTRFIEVNEATSSLWLSSASELDKERNYLDAWGTRILYELNSSQGVLRIRSLGPNKTDDAGKGDDIVIQKKVKLPAPSVKKQERPVMSQTPSGQIIHPKNRGQAHDQLPG